MKILSLLPLLLSASVVAQTPLKYPEAPGVTVIKSSWHTKVHDPQLEQDPLGPSGEKLERDMYRQDEGQRRAGGGSPHPPAPRPKVWRNTRRANPSLGYFFEATIRNSGEKKIRRVVWEYVFLEADGSRETGYRAFASEVNVSPGKSAKMVGYIPREVSSVAEAKEAEEAARKLRGKYVELISIRRIEYEDGTMWRRPSK